MHPPLCAQIVDIAPYSSPAGRLRYAVTGAHCAACAEDIVVLAHPDLTERTLHLATRFHDGAEIIAVVAPK